MCPCIRTVLLVSVVLMVTSSSSSLSSSLSSSSSSLRRGVGRVDQKVLSMLPLDGRSPTTTTATTTHSRMSVDIPTFYHSTDQLYAKFEALGKLHANVDVRFVGTGNSSGTDKTVSLLQVTIRGRNDGNSSLAWHHPLQPPHTKPRKIRTATAAAAAAAVLLFGEHARELITSETALVLAQHLAEAASSSSSPATVCVPDGNGNGNGNGDGDGDGDGNGDGNHDNHEFLRVLRRLSCELLFTGSDVIIIPVANPLGRRLVEGGALCRRTNERGVDLNRNWGR